MARRMSDPSFRQQQWERRFDDHTAPINRLVDELRDEGMGGWMPYRMAQSSETLPVLVHGGHRALLRRAAVPRGPSADLQSPAHADV